MDGLEDPNALDDDGLDSTPFVAPMTDPVFEPPVDGFHHNIITPLSTITLFFFLDETIPRLTTTNTILMIIATRLSSSSPVACLGKDPVRDRDWIQHVLLGHSALALLDHLEAQPQHVTESYDGCT